MSTQPTAASRSDRVPNSRWRAMAPGLLIDIAAPIAAFQALRVVGVATLPALAASWVFPAFGVLTGWLRRRELDGVGMLVLVVIVVGAVSSLLSGSVRFALAKESVFTGVFGLLFLGSLLAPRPLMFYFGRRFRAGQDPAALTYWNGMWRYASFRRANRIMTVVWGVALLLEAILRVVLVYTLPLSVMQALGQILALAVIAILIGWTVRYGNRVQGRARAGGEAESPPRASSSEPAAT
jgi:intracellular septation protein A